MLCSSVATSTVQWTSDQTSRQQATVWFLWVIGLFGRRRGRRMSMQGDQSIPYRWYPSSRFLRKHETGTTISQELFFSPLRIRGRSSDAQEVNDICSTTSFAIPSSLSNDCPSDGTIALDLNGSYDSELELRNMSSIIVHWIVSSNFSLAGERDISSIGD